MLFKTYKIMTKWAVLFQDDFVAEFEAFPETVQNEAYAKAALLEKCGPFLKRPHADTLKGSKHRNMKELRFSADGGVWRIAFAFDPERKGILLVAGDKSGQTGKRFYRRLITAADERFDRHLEAL